MKEAIRRILHLPYSLLGRIALSEAEKVRWGETYKDQEVENDEGRKNSDEEADGENASCIPEGGQKNP